MYLKMDTESDLGGSQKERGYLLHNSNYLMGCSKVIHLPVYNGKAWMSVKHCPEERKALV